MYFSKKEKSLGLIYSTLIYIASACLKGIGHFNAKIKQGVIGRSKAFKTLEKNINKTDKTIWFHCASLGEYEQGLPVFEATIKEYPNHKVILSFFSPSGYEIRKDAAIADTVIYLPLDTKTNAKRFLDIVNPELTIFVKYDIWPNFLNELKRRQHRALLISALFRKKQSYFKFYGRHTRRALFAFEHIFTQDSNSKNLLERINYTSVTVSGDTRFDRVTNQLNIDNHLGFINNFKEDNLLIVVGSSWPEDEQLIVNYINNNDSNTIKFLIAPHNIHSNQIKNLKQSINKKTILYTETTKQDLSSIDVFILDTIGLLNKAYSYADIAYVGGAMGRTGLHNTLEPAIFGVPIIIGKQYDNFPEAKDMLRNKGLFSISNQDELNHTLNNLINDKTYRESSGTLNKMFIEQNTGAVIQIMDYIRK